jgi:hypothetical protein
VTSTLMAMAAPMVMSFLGKRVRDEGMSMSGLGSLLKEESGTIRSALPAGLSDLFWPRASVAATASPVVAQAVERERSSFSWLPILALRQRQLVLVDDRQSGGVGRPPRPGRRSP